MAMNLCANRHVMNTPIPNKLVEFTQSDQKEILITVYNDAGNKFDRIAIYGARCNRLLLTTFIMSIDLILHECQLNGYYDSSICTHKGCEPKLPGSCPIRLVDYFTTDLDQKKKKTKDGYSQGIGITCFSDVKGASGFLGNTKLKKNNITTGGQYNADGEYNAEMKVSGGESSSAANTSQLNGDNITGSDNAMEYGGGGAMEVVH